MTALPTLCTSIDNTCLSFTVTTLSSDDVYLTLPSVTLSGVTVTSS